MNVLHGVVYTKLVKITFSRFLSPILGVPVCFWDYVHVVIHTHYYLSNLI